MIWEQAEKPSNVIGDHPLSTTMAPIGNSRITSLAITATQIYHTDVGKSSDRKVELVLHFEGGSIALDHRSLISTAEFKQFPTEQCKYVEANDNENARLIRLSKNCFCRPFLTVQNSERQVWFWLNDDLADQFFAQMCRLKDWYLGLIQPSNDRFKIEDSANHLRISVSNIAVNHCEPLALVSEQEVPVPEEPVAIESPVEKIASHRYDELVIRMHQYAAQIRNDFYKSGSLHELLLDGFLLANARHPTQVDAWNDLINEHEAVYKKAMTKVRQLELPE
jgi:hypothetical protein